MKIIYLTTSLESKDYIEFNASWQFPLNPSNQNFHNKMIRSLALNNKIEVISIRPFSRTNCNIKKLTQATKEDGNITWHYLKINTNPFLRKYDCFKQARRLLLTQDLNRAVIITDTINPNTLSISLKLSKEFSIPAIGVCTDSPSNISGTGKSYSLYILNRAHKLDGYITLTPSLNELFNVTDKPFEIINGIVENDLPRTSKVVDYPYFFFGGALMKRYGIYNLITAFSQLNRPDVHLIICGHHADNNSIKEAIGTNENIHYLHAIPINEAIKYEMNAIANINPRPYSEDLDRFSIPSKTLEYLASGSPTISVRNTRLQKDFSEEAIWIKSANTEDIISGLNHALKLKEFERDELGKRAQTKVRTLYSLSTINGILNSFLENFIK